MIDAKREPTAHRLIYKANERAIPPEKLWMQIGGLEAGGRQQYVAAALEVLAQLMPE